MYLSGRISTRGSALFLSAQPVQRNMSEAIELSNLKQAIADGAKDVFSTMLMLEIEAGEPLPASERKVPAQMTSMLGLGGDIRGTLAIHCPEATALSITGAFLGMEVEELGEDVKDAIGELANMIAGNLKIFFAEEKVNVELSIPTSVVGDSFKLSGLSGSIRCIVPFSSDCGVFWVELLFVCN